MKIITLTNGKRVANFSSPHEFIFTDGTVLPACSSEQALNLSVIFNETIDDTNGDVELTFELTRDVFNHMKICSDYHNRRLVDVVFIAMPMMVAIKELYSIDWIKTSPFRVIRIEDRIKKLVSIDKQCL